jgi:putative glutamine amidotransferase
MARAAVDGGLPTLAICRGVQVLNVALGGTLHQHIGDWGSPVGHRSEDGEEGCMHPVRVQPGSRLAKAMEVERADAYSHHHQALDRVADGLVPVAWSDDDLLEAVEAERGWALGVQWHAEATAGTDPAQQRLFDTLVEQAGAALR